MFLFILFYLLFFRVHLIFIIIIINIFFFLLYQVLILVTFVLPVHIVLLHMFFPFNLILLLIFFPILFPILVISVFLGHLIALPLLVLPPLAPSPVSLPRPSFYRFLSCRSKCITGGFLALQFTFIAGRAQAFPPTCVCVRPHSLTHTNTIKQTFMREQHMLRNTEQIRT